MIKPRRSVTLVLSALTILLAWGVQARAEDRTFLSLATAPGESTDPAHTGWIDAYALDAGATNPGGGATVFGDIAVLKGTDKATPVLYDAIARNVTFPLATIEVCRNTAPQQCYYKIELTSARLSSVQLSGSSCVGSGACTPTQTESVAFRYTRIKWSYTPWTGGSAGTPVTKCYDLVSQVAC